MKFVIKAKTTVGDIVLVNNYRRTFDPWEQGKIVRVQAELYLEGKYDISYSVRLNRIPKSGWAMTLHVGQDEIKSLPREHIEPNKPWPRK